MFRKTVWLVWGMIFFAFTGLLQAQSIVVPTDSVKGPMCVITDVCVYDCSQESALFPDRVGRDA